jgi:DNA-binding MarR family transcriptional regulator
LPLTLAGTAAPENNPDPKRPVAPGSVRVPFDPEAALGVLHRLNLDLVVNREVDLSVRQLAILLTIYLDQPPHTVRGLAHRLGVTKPVITRALDSMGELDLVARRRDPSDRRNVIIQRTVKGTLYLQRLGDLLVEKLREQMP